MLFGIPTNLFGRLHRGIELLPNLFLGLLGILDFLAARRAHSRRRAEGIGATTGN